MITYLNLADILWELDNHSEAEEHYITYMWMMRNNDLSEQIPPRADERTALTFAPSIDSEMITTLYEQLLPNVIHLEIDLKIDSCILSESGGYEIFLSNLQGPSAEYGSFDYNLMWIEVDENGNLVSYEDITLDNTPILSFPDFGESENLRITSMDESGDTLWACTFEDKPLEWFHGPDITELDEGFIIDNHPEGWSNSTHIHRISDGGNELFDFSLSSQYVLDDLDATAELFPRIHSFRETETKNILVSGGTSLWLNSPSASFVLLLEGETGDILWKMKHFGLASSLISDAIETSSGLIVAVGVTGRHNWPMAAGTRSVWTASEPFVAMMNSSGELLRIIVCDFEFTTNLYSIVELDSAENEFLIAGIKSSSRELVLIKMKIQPN